MTTLAQQADQLVNLLIEALPMCNTDEDSWHPDNWYVQNYGASPRTIRIAKSTFFLEVRIGNGDWAIRVNYKIASEGTLDGWNDLSLIQKQIELLKLTTISYRKIMSTTESEVNRRFTLINESLPKLFGWTMHETPYAKRHELVGRTLTMRVQTGTLIDSNPSIDFHEYENGDVLRDALELTAVINDDPNIQMLYEYALQLGLIGEHEWKKRGVE